MKSSVRVVGTVVILAVLVVMVIINPTLLWPIAAAVVLATAILVRPPAKVLMVLALLSLLAVTSIFAVANFSISSRPPRKTQAVEFVLEANLVEQGDQHSWDQRTTITLTNADLDRILAVTTAGKSPKVSKMTSKQRDEAVASVLELLAADGYVAGDDGGSTVSVTRTDTSDVPGIGAPPSKRLSETTTLLVATPTVAGIVLLPNDKSVVRVTSPCLAFIEVSPAGESVCTGETEEREISLDQGGSVERTSVTGRVVHPALRYEPLSTLAGWSYNDFFRWLAALGAAVLVALQKDFIERIVKRLKKEEPEPAAG